MLSGVLAGLVAGMGISEAVAADLAANPYQTIPERNLFHLNPPPPPAPAPETKVPTPKIFLTGISTLGGRKAALLKTAPQGKPGEPPKERSYMLGEGERQDDLEVVAIDAPGGIVNVRYNGDAISVNFKDNAVASTTPAAPGPPGAPGVPGAMVPRGIVAPPAGGGFHPAGMPPAAAPSPVASSQPGDASAGAGGGMGMGGGLAASGPMPSLEEQAVLIELNRDQHKGEADYPPFPPTVLTEALDAANQADAAAAAGANTPATHNPTAPTLPIPGRPPGFPSSF